MKLLRNNDLTALTRRDQTPIDVFPPQGSGQHGLWTYLDVLRRRKWIVLASILLGALAGLTAGLRVVPKYVASSMVEIQDYNAAFLNQKELQVTADSPQQLSDVYLQSQLNILNSDTIARRVVERLGLDQNTAHTEQSVSPSERLLSDLGLEPWISQFDKEGRPSAIRRLLSLRPSHSMKPLEQAIEVTKNNLKVKPLPQSRIVQISFASPNAQLAKSIADTVAAEFRDFNEENRTALSSQTETLLRKQLATAKAELDVRQSGMQDYARKSGLVILGEGHHAAEEKLRQVQADLTRTSAERAAREAELKISVSVSPETLGSVLDNPTIRDHSTRLAQLRQELAENTALYTAEFPKVKRLAAQVEELERTIRIERSRLIQRVKNDYEAAVSRESLIAATYREQTNVISEEAAKRVHYDSLKRDLDSRFAFYRDMTGRLQTAEIAGALHSSNVRIVDSAALPILPGKPDLQLLLGFGLVMGVLLGVVSAFLRERYELQRDGYQSPGESSISLRLPELGVIPAIELPSSSSSWWSPSKAESLSSAMATAQVGASMVTEAYTSLSASILINRSTPDKRVFAFISDLPGSGKSTTVLNLAKGLVEVGQRVLIVDGDLRRPRLHIALNVPNNWGLSTLIAEQQDLSLTPLDQLARRTEIPGLFLLPSGPGVSNPARLLASNTLGILMKRLRKEFDLILIDTPPAALFADARFLGREADGNILVIRSRHNDPEEIDRIVDRFQKDGATIVGTVLNEWRDGRKDVLRAAYATYS